MTVRRRLLLERVCSAGGEHPGSPAAVQESGFETSLAFSDQVLQDEWSGFESRARLGHMAGVHGTTQSRGWSLCVHPSHGRWERHHSVSVLA